MAGERVTRVPSAKHQIPLAMQLRDEATLDNFLAVPAVAPLLPALRGQLRPDGEAVIFLFGPVGAGKTHLLQGACHLAGAGAQYLPLADLRDCAAQDVLQGLEALDLVCLDDFDRVCGQSHWEQALFNLFNQLRDAGARLLVSADRAAAALPLQLVDLRSRLEWGPGYQLLGLDDVGRAQLLNRSAENRGLELPPETLNYILARAPRDTRSLLELLQRLDRASLAAQRRLTVPFVRRVFEEADY